MSALARASWPVHLGDLTVTMTGPLPWAHEQRAVLGDYLPGPIGRYDLGHLRLDVHHDDRSVHQLTIRAGTRADARRMETIPGVTTIEVPDGRSRVLTVAVDSLEGEQGTHAVRVTDDHVELLLHSASRRQHRLPLRVLREAMIRTYENAGATLLHAAGATVRGIGVAVCGPRATGKTTTLAALLAATRGDLLSNDRLLLPPPGPNGQTLVAVPLPVPLACGTIEAVDSVRASLATTRRPCPPLESLPRVFGSHVKAELTAREFAIAMGGRITAGARLGLLVVPRLTDDDTPFTARPLVSTEAHDVLDASCFTPFDEFWLVPWLIPHRAVVDELVERSRRHVATVAATTPAVEVRFGVRNPFIHLVDGLRRSLAEPL
jgi:hypothetical protein